MKKKKKALTSSKKDHDLNLVTLVYAIKDNTKNMLLYKKYIEHFLKIVFWCDYRPAREIQVVWI